MGVWCCGRVVAGHRLRCNGKTHSGVIQFPVMEVSHIIGFGIIALGRAIWEGYRNWKEENLRQEKERLLREAQQRAEIEQKRREQELVMQQKQELLLNYQSWQTASERELREANRTAAVKHLQRIREWDFKD